MHLHRLLALGGVAIGVLGLFFKSLSTEGEGALPALNRQAESLPGSIPTIWGALEPWGRVALVGLIAIVIWIAVRPYVELTFSRSFAFVIAGCGVVLFAYAVIKFLDAVDSARMLEAAFQQAVGAGVAGVSAWSVSPSIGFFVLSIGTVAVALGGVLSLISTAG